MSSNNFLITLFGSFEFHFFAKKWVVRLAWANANVEEALVVNNEAQHVYIEHWKMKALANINLF